MLCTICNIGASLNNTKSCSMCYIRCRETQTGTAWQPETGDNNMSSFDGWPFEMLSALMCVVARQSSKRSAAEPSDLTLSINRISQSPARPADTVHEEISLAAGNVRQRHSGPYFLPAGDFSLSLHASLHKMSAFSPCREWRRLKMWWSRI